MTLSRDFKKWNPNSNQINLYQYWLQVQGIPDGHELEVKKQFVMQIAALLNAKKLKLHPSLDEKLRVLCDFTSQVIRSFY